MRRTLTLFLSLVLVVPAGAARQPVRARHGMIVAMEATAADVGVSVLQKGGNAVDAAVAVGFALAVTHPFAGNLGGGGYMVIRLADGRATFIDFRERAPEKASRNMYLDASGNLTRDSIEGWRSSGVSSMTPTIILKDGKLFMTAGAPGGSRISTAVLQVILNVVDFGMNVQDAVDAPRFHHQWLPDTLYLERGISPDTIALLKAHGYDIDDSPGVVLAQVAAIVSDGGWLQGGSDGRSAAGKAAGY
jgi:gamma-glutamyltranspeptidase